jgi:hypothetical protein
VDPDLKILREMPDGLATEIVSDLNEIIDGVRPSPEMQEASSCSHYEVLKDPISKAVLFVIPYFKYRDNDPL